MTIIINIHVSLWVRKVNDKSNGDVERYFHYNSHRLSIADAPRLSQATDSIPHFAMKKVIESNSNVSTQRDSNQINSLRRKNQPPSTANIVSKNIPAEDLLPQSSELPAFSQDHSDYLLSSIIERSTSSSNLHLTTFFLCHNVLNPSQSAVEKVDPKHRHMWRRAMETFTTIRYLPSGARMQELESEKFYCKISHSSESEYYTVPGMFLPNRLTTDNNANRLLDVMRCPMMDSVKAFLKFANSNGSISVAIIRGKDVISKFSVPWKTRRTGYLQSTSKAASRLDTWKGHYSILDQKTTLKDPVDLLHICIPGSQRKPSKEALPLVLEYVSHHLLIGASHITLPVSLPWGSPDMNRYIDVLQTYIQEGNSCLESKMHSVFFVNNQIS